MKLKEPNFILPLQWVDTDPLNQPNYIQMRSEGNKFSDDLPNGYHSPYNSLNSMGNGGNMGGMGMGGFGPSPYMDRGGPPFQGAFGNEGPMRPYMSPNSGTRPGGYGNFGPGGEHMGFDPRMRGDMGSGGGQTPTDDPQMMSGGGGSGGWGFNQQEHLMNRMRGFERMGMHYSPQMYGGFGGGGGSFPGGMHPNQGGDGPLRGFGRHGGNPNGPDSNSYAPQHGYNQGPAGPSPMDRNQPSVESAPPPKGNSSALGGGSNKKTESSRGNTDDDGKEV